MFWLIYRTQGHTKNVHLKQEMYRTMYTVGVKSFCYFSKHFVNQLSVQAMWKLSEPHPFGLHYIGRIDSVTVHSSNLTSILFFPLLKTDVVVGLNIQISNFMFGFLTTWLDPHFVSPGTNHQPFISKENDPSLRGSHEF